MHTPGPWLVLDSEEQFNDSRPIIAAHGGKTLVAEILGPLSDEDGDARGLFDARLIAATPCLLAACKAVEPLLRLLAAKTNKPKNVVATLNAVAATIDLAEGA